MRRIHTFNLAFSHNPFKHLQPQENVTSQPALLQTSTQSHRCLRQSGPQNAQLPQAAKRCQDQASKTSSFPKVSTAAALVPQMKGESCFRNTPRSERLFSLETFGLLAQIKLGYLNCKHFVSFQHRIVCHHPNKSIQSDLCSKATVSWWNKVGAYHLNIVCLMVLYFSTVTVLLLGQLLLFWHRLWNSAVCLKWEVSGHSWANHFLEGGWVDLHGVWEVLCTPYIGGSAQHPREGLPV